MKRIFCLSVSILAFSVIETLMFSIFATVLSLIINNDFEAKPSLVFFFGVTWFRIAIYFMPQLLLFYLAIRFIKYDLNGFKLSIINLFSFITISVFLLGFITNDLKEFLWKPLPYYFIIATFISPLITKKLPFLRAIVQKI